MFGNQREAELIKSTTELLDSIEYDHDFLANGFFKTNRPYQSALMTRRRGKGVCADGAFLAAFELMPISSPTLLLMHAYSSYDVSGEELLLPEKGIHHGVSLYELEDGRLGTIGLSKYDELTHRDPNFYTVKDLVSSFRDGYSKALGEETSLIAYTLLKLKIENELWQNVNFRIPDLPDAQYAHKPAPLEYIVFDSDGQSQRL